MLQKYQRVLVAGGAGFIGSHIVDELLKANIDVTVLDNLSTGRMENLKQHRHNKNLHFVKGDIRKAGHVREAIKNADAVFNDAAVVSVRLSVENPLLINAVNVNGALNLLKASVDCCVKRFVQASSASIYGETKTLPVTEDMSPQPISPYAVSELAAENYARVFHKVYGLETICLRYFNVYGPRQLYSEYTGAITIFMNRLLHNHPLTIYGDGEQTRDFVYVEDVARANMLALAKKEASGGVFNIATGTATSINTLVQTLMRTMTKTHRRPSYGKLKPGEIKHSYASIEKAKKTLRYKPMFTIDKGLRKLVEWYTSSPKRP
ncbi:MAG TPA: SDR family NAD(P)-dependent oxidoreductase [Candidatus Bathyarchaeia archaeon]|nr:SDR family NAD(P)-dependent oxidoreductase [Candidatus Bathyarchaeia archaeon]